MASSWLDGEESPSRLMASTAWVGGSPTLKSEFRIARRAWRPMAVGVCLPLVGTPGAHPKRQACRTKRRVTRENSPVPGRQTGRSRSRALSLLPVGAAIALRRMQEDHGAPQTRTRLAYGWTDSQSQLAQQDWCPFRWWPRQQPAPRRRKEVKREATVPINPRPLARGFVAPAARHMEHPAADDKETSAGTPRPPTPAHMPRCMVFANGLRPATHTYWSQRRSLMAIRPARRDSEHFVSDRNPPASRVAGDDHDQTPAAT